MITVNVTASNYQVTSTSVDSLIQVSADNILFTVTNQVTNFEVVTTPSPAITFLTEGGGFDFMVKHRGEWQSGETYTRNDVVRYQYSIYINTLDNLELLVSTTPPNLDSANWELFIFNEWPRAYLTVTNALVVNGTQTIGGLAQFNSGVQISSLTQGRIVFSGANGQLSDSAQLTFNTSTGVLSAGGFSATVLSATSATFNNLTALDNFYINGLRYPSNVGLYGQVLVTNGVNQAQWLNLGDIVFWNLSSDLQTNGFNIVTGSEAEVPNPQLTIGSGSTANLDSYIRFVEGGSSIVINGGSTGVRTTSQARFDLDVRIDGKLKAEDNGTPVNVEYGLRFSDGTVLTSASGGGGGGGSLPIATSTTLGGIKVGGYLTIDATSGVLSVDYQNLPNSYTLPTAGSLVKGGVKIGSGLTMTGEVLSVNTATIVVDIPVATNSVLGAVKVGSGLVMTGENLDTLAVNPSLVGGVVNLSEDMSTNGFKIAYNKNNVGSSGSYLDVNSNNIELYSGGNLAQASVRLTSTSSTIEHQSEVIVKSPITTVGSDIYNSRLHVSRIYNYSGVGPPLFPAGVQFGDQTVQLTAYLPNDMGPIYGGTMLSNGVDFNNLTFAVDYNL